MRYLDLTLDTPQDNLACDEALLDLCEDGEEPPILRCWEPRQLFVVLGYATSHRTEVNLDACRQDRIPILRRISGGGAVLQGPGCLNVSLILRIARHGPLSTISGTTRFVLERHRQAIQPLLDAPLTRQGASDLALGARKCAGHAQRRKRRCVLFHGSFLLNADLALIERALPLPSRQPAYRRNRRHADFLINLRLPPGRVKAALQQIWGTTALLDRLPADQITHLATTRYATDSWNYRL